MPIKHSKIATNPGNPKVNDTDWNAEHVLTYKAYSNQTSLPPATSTTLYNVSDLWVMNAPSSNNTPPIFMCISSVPGGGTTPTYTYQWASLNDGSNINITFTGNVNENVKTGLTYRNATYNLVTGKIDLTIDGAPQTQALFGGSTLSFFRVKAGNNISFVSDNSQQSPANTPDLRINADYPLIFANPAQPPATQSASYTFKLGDYWWDTTSTRPNTAVYVLIKETTSTTPPVVTTYTWAPLSSIRVKSSPTGVITDFDYIQPGTNVSFTQDPTNNKGLLINSAGGTSISVYSGADFPPALQPAGSSTIYNVGDIYYDTRQVPALRSNFVAAYTLVRKIAGTISGSFDLKWTSYNNGVVYLGKTTLPIATETASIATYKIGDIWGMSGTVCYSSTNPLAYICSNIVYSSGVWTYTWLELNGARNTNINFPSGSGLTGGTLAVNSSSPFGNQLTVTGFPNVLATLPTGLTPCSRISPGTGVTFSSNPVTSSQPELLINTSVSFFASYDCSPVATIINTTDTYFQYGAANFTYGTTPLVKIDNSGSINRNNGTPGAISSAGTLGTIFYNSSTTNDIYLQLSGTIGWTPTVSPAGSTTLAGGTRVMYISLIEGSAITGTPATWAVVPNPYRRFQNFIQPPPNQSTSSSYNQTTSNVISTIIRLPVSAITTGQYRTYYGFVVTVWQNSGVSITIGDTSSASDLGYNTELEIIQIK